MYDIIDIIISSMKVTPEDWRETEHYNYGIQVQRGDIKVVIGTKESQGFICLSKNSNTNFGPPDSSNTLEVKEKFEILKQAVESLLKHKEDERNEDLKRRIYDVFSKDTPGNKMGKIVSDLKKQ